MIPSTTERVPLHTTESINREIYRKTEAKVAAASMGGPQAIDRRLQELDREWDIERALEANAAIFTMFGVVWGATADRRWFLLPAAVGAFLLQHAIEGWCPPVSLFRWMGFRTQWEIERERYVLKALRGDFTDIQGGEGPAAAAEALKAASR
ncbi:MAG: YgaP family membrane protein [Planctomycetota bacterium]